MQQTQRREISEQMSWARAMIFAIGTFFLAALVIAQVPSYIYLQMTAASLVGAEQGSFALGLTCLGGFAIIQVIMLLFDPKPVVPPVIFPGLGALLSLGGLALMLFAVLTGCSKASPIVCNQYFPTESTNLFSVLGGKFLWFQAGAFDLVMIGTVIFGVGVAMIFYGILAIREQRNPDRSDPGTTPAIRLMIIAGAVLLAAFFVFYTYVSDIGLGYALFPGAPSTGEKVVDLVLSTILGLAILMTLGAFALRLHYLMRPVRRRTMSALYGFGALGLAQIGVLLVLFGIFVYPLIAWIHSWTFLGLGNFLTICSIKTSIPASCSFSQQSGYLVDAIVTTNFFIMMMASIVAWKTHRNLVVVGGVVTAAVLALATLLVHMHSDELLIALLLCGGALVLAAVWTSVARREFAVIGERNLGCLGMWLIVGTCLFIYLAAFAFFSVPGFHETEPNVPFTPGLVLPTPGPGGIATPGANDAFLMFVLMGIIAAIQFFFLIRNRYKV